jgi:pyruvate/2-oxoglutarate dehydrogenase complex dihydrolipoamide acyltransferase (E2) component
MPRGLMTTRRRMTIATWKPPREGVIYGMMTLDATNVLEYIDRARETTGEKVTITSFVGAAVGRALALEPTLNGYIAWGKYYNYDDVSVSFLVQVDGGKQLAQVRVADVDTMSPADVAGKLQGGASSIRSGKDENFKKSAGIASKVPTWALRRIFSLAGFMTVAVGKPFGGQPAYPFGAAIITSVGMLGVDVALVPPTPFARVPLYVAVGAIKDMVFAVDGKPEVRKGITITATMDHRFVDGFQAATVARAFGRFFDEPDTLGPLSAPQASGTLASEAAKLEQE